MLHLYHYATSWRGAALRGAALGAIVLAAVTPEVARAGACSDEVAAALAGRKGLHIQTMAGDWKPLRSSVQTGQVKRFAYVGRLTDDVSERQGAAVVRFARLRGPADEEAKTIGLRRPDAVPSCGMRALRLFSAGLLSWTRIDFTGGEPVDVDIFIAHHMADQDLSSVITDFHIDYRSLNEGCVSTQKNSHGRRTAFLAVADGDAERAVPTVASRVFGTLFPTAQASPSDPQPERPGTAPAPSTSATAPTGYRERFRRERQAFAAYGVVETQIHTYPLTSNRVCVSFAPSRSLDASPGARWSVEIVDLDTPHQSTRRDRYKIDWR